MYEAPNVDCTAQLPFFCSLPVAASLTTPLSKNHHKPSANDFLEIYLSSDIFSAVPLVLLEKSRGIPLKFKGFLAFHTSFFYEHFAKLTLLISN